MIRRMSRHAYNPGMSMRQAIVVFVVLAGGQVLAQQAAPPGLPPLFFREEWKQIDRPANAPADFVPEGGVTPAAVTNANLELRLYDPNAKSVPAYLKQPPAGSIARDWGGPSCIQLAGYNQNPPPAKVAAGQATDPPNLWTGVCQTAVAATLRDKTSYVDLTGLARIRWVTRVSGFHVVRPVVKLADGTWLVGELRRRRAFEQLDAVSAVRVCSRQCALAAARHHTCGDPRSGICREAGSEQGGRSRLCRSAARQRSWVGRLRQRRAV